MFRDPRKCESICRCVRGNRFGVNADKAIALRADRRLSRYAVRPQPPSPCCSRAGLAVHLDHDRVCGSDGRLLTGYAQDTRGRARLDDTKSLCFLADGEAAALLGGVPTDRIGQSMIRVPTLNHDLAPVTAIAGQRGFVAFHGKRPRSSPAGAACPAWQRKPDKTTMASVPRMSRTQAPFTLPPLRNDGTNAGRRCYHVI